MDHWEKIKHNERVFSLRKSLDVRIGEDAVRQTGYSREMLDQFMRNGYHKLKEGICRLLFRCPKGLIVLYAVNMERQIRLCTREDMKSLGAEEVCDMLDMGIPRG